MFSVPDSAADGAVPVSGTRVFLHVLIFCLFGMSSALMVSVCYDRKTGTNTLLSIITLPILTSVLQFRKV